MFYVKVWLEGAKPPAIDTEMSQERLSHVWPELGELTNRVGFRRVRLVLDDRTIEIRRPKTEEELRD